MIPTKADPGSPTLPDLFDQIFSATPLPMLMLDGERRVLAASDEWQPRGDTASVGTATGSAVVGAVAQASAELPDTPLRQRAPHYLACLPCGPHGGIAQQADSVRLSPSGAVVHERLHLRPTRWGASLTVIDDTDLRQLQTDDMQTARLAALGFMVAGVCHEVTNPLTALHSIVQILRSEQQPSQELLDKGLASIAVNVKRILEISRRLVKFSRVSDEPRCSFAVDNAIEEALGVLRQEGLLEGIDLRHEHAPAARVFGHVGQVREIFLNLFVNAVQAMAGHGQLRIDTQARGEMAVIRVADSGPGVRPELAARIFEPFFTTREAAHGTGLGLAISSEIAHEHGGGVALCDSSAQGSCFSVTLPRERP